MKVQFLPLFFLCLLSLKAFPQVAKPNDNGYYEISHSWTYKETEWKWSFIADKRLYDYYRYERIHLCDDYNRYVFSDYDRKCINNIVDAFRNAGKTACYTDSDNVYNAVSFVQSLRYVSDKESRGEEDYVRYPVETLIDKEGDCEDMVVLLATILDEMGYGIVFLQFPGHMALGICCNDDFEGVYYRYNGKRYFYLETTAKNWKIGVVPDEFRDRNPVILPLVNKPVVHLNRCEYHGDSYYLTDETVDFALTCDYENTGPGNTNDLYLHVIVQPQGNPNQMYFERYFKLDDLDEGESNRKIVQIKMPRPIRAMIEFRIEGSNVDTKSMLLEGVKLK